MRNPQDLRVRLDQVAAQPARFASTIVLADGDSLRGRPLIPTDAPALADFLRRLSAETRRLSTFDSYDQAAADALCAAIAVYDKLRLVVVDPPGTIAGLFELGFGIPVGEAERYAGYGIPLHEGEDCRFGPTLADEYQGRGIGTPAFVWVRSIIERFGCRRVILWGGVLADNHRALRYYARLGFARAGSFTRDGQQHHDMMLSF